MKQSQRNVEMQSMHRSAGSEVTSGAGPRDLLTRLGQFFTAEGRQLWTSDLLVLAPSLCPVSSRGHTMVAESCREPVKEKKSRVSKSERSSSVTKHRVDRVLRAVGKSSISKSSHIMKTHGRDFETMQVGSLKTCLHYDTQTGSDGKFGKCQSENLGLDSLLHLPTRTVDCLPSSEVTVVLSGSI